MSFTRDDGLTLLKSYVTNDRMLIHSYASEAVMRALASRLGKDEDQWGMAGLLHDIDIEYTGGDLSRHALEAEKLLGGKDIDPGIVDAIKMHNEIATGLPRTTMFQHALAAGETITGLIIATAMVYPDKKIASVKPKSITKRMKEKAFAASVRRENILECEQIGLDLQEFVEISLKAMTDIGDTLGL
jgi:uncharacterized protein